MTDTIDPDPRLVYCLAVTLPLVRALGYDTAEGYKLWGQLVTIARDDDENLTPVIRVGRADASYTVLEIESDIRSYIDQLTECVNEVTVAKIRVLGQLASEIEGAFGCDRSDLLSRIAASYGS